MSVIKNIKVKGTTYSITDANTLPALTTAQRTTLLSSGTYLGSSVDTGKVFETTDGKFEQFVKTPIHTPNTWSSTTFPLSKTWRSLAYGNNTFVIVGSQTDQALYSTDGINWTTATLPSNDSWFSIVYGNGKFVAITYDSNVSAYSTDGINWSSSTLPSTEHWYKVVYGNGKFVAIASAHSSETTGKVAYSTDGINWTTATLPSPSAYWQDIIYGNGKFVAVATADSYGVYSSNKIAYSTDGINWTQTTLPSSASWRNLVYGNGKFMVFKNSPNAIAYSSDGINWSEMEIDKNFSNVSYEDGVFIATYLSKSNKAAYSTDGITWTETTLPSTGYWGVCSFVNNMFIVLNANNSCAYSTATTTYIYNLTPLSYNKTETDTALATKQETLTAGTGIDITNDVISVTTPTLTNTATGEGSITINGTSSSVVGSLNVGTNSQANGNGSIAIGTTSRADGLLSVALGSGSSAGGTNSIQLGAGLNNEAGTLHVLEYTLMNANGTIPPERLSNFIEIVDGEMPTPPVEGKIYFVIEEQS